jgi:uncharacterized protein with ParB-like and HNH nuclease domain
MNDSNDQRLSEQLDAQRKKVDSDNFDVTVRELVRMVSEQELKRAPEYQRQFRWDEARESKLVESIFLGLPVPTIFVAADRDGTWELVDGLQRVSTLVHYIADPPDSVASVGKSEPLILSDLEKLSEFNGKRFSELPTALQLSFQKRPLRLTALSDKSDLDVRFDMFERLNTGGIELTPQEIRACIFRGDFNDFLKSLACNPNFDALLKLQQSNENDGTREELVLKFFAYLENRTSFGGRVKDFLNSYMKNLPADYDFASRRELFDLTVKKLRDTIGGPVLRRTANWTPINLMEAVLVGAAELIRGGHLQFSPSGDWLNDERLTQTSSKGTNTRNYLNGRIERARELLAGAEPRVA